MAQQASAADIKKFGYVRQVAIQIIRDTLGGRGGGLANMSRDNFMGNC
jgi:hypothetical protein